MVTTNEKSPQGYSNNSICNVDNSFPRCPLLRQVLGLFYLSFIPGALILGLLGFDSKGKLSFALYYVGLSIAFDVRRSAGQRAVSDSWYFNTFVDPVSDCHNKHSLADHVICISKKSWFI